MSSEKKRTTVYISEDLHELAKRERINMSKTLENDLKRKLSNLNASSNSRENEKIWCGGRDLNPRTPAGQRPQRNFSKKFHQKEQKKSLFQKKLLKNSSTG